MVSEGVTVSCVFPTVAVNLIGASHATGRQHDCPRLKEYKSPAFAGIAEGTGDTTVILDDTEDRGLHVNFDSLMDTVILEGPDHLEASAIPNVSQSRETMTAEVALQDA